MNSREIAWFSWRDSTLNLAIALQPGAKRDEFNGQQGDSLKVRVQAPPVDGRANHRLIEFLATSFGVPRSNVLLIRGATSRRKIVRVQHPQRFPEELQLLGLHAPSGKGRK